MGNNELPTLALVAMFLASLTGVYFLGKELLRRGGK